ncbi:MAG: oxidoreductase [Janthinobacterium lividum]
MILHDGPIRVGLIGYGYAGRTFHAPLIAATAGLQLVAVASSDAAKVHADLPDVVVVGDPMALAGADSVDLVVIASPNDTHVRLARAALDAGKAVVVDKPFTVDLADARALAAHAQRLGLLLSVFHNRRWDSDFLSVKRAIDDGLLGRVIHFESHVDRYRPQVRDRWREGSGSGSGIWFDLGPHLVDQALQLFSLPDRVQANLASQRTGALTDDWAHVLLEYDVRRVVLHAGMLVAGGSNRFVAHGETGSLVKRRLDRQEAQLMAGLRPGAPGWGADPDDMLFYDATGTERTLASVAGDQRVYYTRIFEALTGRGVNPVPPAQAVATMAVIDAAILSARTGRVVDMQFTAEERAAFGR